ncbi:hypothetical protein SAV14893_093380 [Streptomyces avermitilis]|nr:hypothetical protein SAVMC3_03040 [Streptomyces avermitilis]GDY69945.1 hypothetical protein SAV14893_093380 [Streptomyces avermitilis]
MLCTTLRPTTGHAQVAGADITRSPHDVRRQIGVVFQESTTDDDLTAQENLRLYADLYGIYLYSARLLSVLGCPCLPLVCRHTPNDIDSHFARSDVPVSCSYALNLSESQAAGDGPAGRVGGIVMDLDAVDAQGRVVQVMCPG